MKFISWFVLISIAFFLYSCSDDGITPPLQKTKVAAILDMSGHYSQFGEEVKQGVELYHQLNKINNFEVTYFDSKGDSEIALDYLNQLSTDSNYKAVITLASWVSNAVAPVAQQMNLLHFAVGSAVFNYPDNGNTIRMTGDVIDESNYLIDYLKDFNSVAIFYFSNDYGKGWKDRLSLALGDKLISSYYYSDTDTDFSQPLANLKEKNPEIILLISTREAVDIVKQANQVGITSKFLGNRPILTDALLQEPAAENLVFSYPQINEESKAYKQYEQTFKRKPSSFVAEGYDFAGTLEMALRNKKFVRDDVYKFNKNYSYSGLFKKINFDNNAQAVIDFELKIIKNKNYQDYK